MSVCFVSLAQGQQRNHLAGEVDFGRELAASRKKEIGGPSIVTMHEAGLGHVAKRRSLTTIATLAPITYLDIALHLSTGDMGMRQHHEPRCIKMRSKQQ
jgi:hypothetical protein